LPKVQPAEGARTSLTDDRQTTSNRVQLIACELRT